MDELQQKYTESVSTIRRRTPTLFKCCSLIFDRIHKLNFSITVTEVVNSVDYESAVHTCITTRAVLVAYLYMFGYQL